MAESLQLLTVTWLRVAFKDSHTPVEGDHQFYCQARLPGLRNRDKAAAFLSAVPRKLQAEPNRKEEVQTKDSRPGMSVFHGGGLMRTFSKKAVATLLVSALLWVGCAKHQNDENIAHDVQSKLAADPVAKGSTVSVTTKDGNVTLKGTVKDPATKQRVEQIAREEPGAKRVADETTVVAIPASEQALNTPAAMPALPPVEKPKPEPIIVPAGAALTVTVDQALNSKTSQTGQVFLAASAQPVTVDGKTAIPKGSSVTGAVVIAKEQGKIKGKGELALTLTNITIYEKSYAIQTGTLDSAVQGKGKRTAATTGGGAAGGALIGGLAGGGKGAGIGAAVGAVGGLVGGTLTGDKQVEIPAESALTFILSEPLTVAPHAD